MIFLIKKVLSAYKITYYLSMQMTKYQDILKKILNKGYSFIKFDQLNQSDKLQILLRHDIDLEVDLALKMAKIEKEMGVESTYFFLMSNESYNLISSTNIKKLKEIKDLGHTISLHFDMTIYRNSKIGFSEESDLFNKIFKENINIVSIHRPIKDFLEKPDCYFDIPNTYEKTFTKDISYFSDSGGSFRYGHPLDSKAFLNNKNIQLCIHPVWWIDNKEDIHQTIYGVVERKKERCLEHFDRSIKTFQPSNKKIA